MKKTPSMVIEVEAAVIAYRELALYPLLSTLFISRSFAERRLRDSRFEEGIIASRFALHGLKEWMGLHACVMTSKSMTRKIRSTHPYRVNTVAVKNLANRFVKTDLVTSSRFPPSVFDEVLRLCALHCSTTSHVCDHITGPGHPSLDTVSTPIE